MAVAHRAVALLSQWALTPIGCFILGNKAGEMCASVCNVYLTTPAQSVLAPEMLLAFIQSSITIHFAGLVKMGDRVIGKADHLGAHNIIRRQLPRDLPCSGPGTPEFEADFDKSFALGPGGVHGLIGSIAPAYLVLPEVLKSGVAETAVSRVYDELLALSYALLRCVEHLRMRHTRSQWDPTGGYREFAIIRENKDSYFPVRHMISDRHYPLNHPT